MELLGRLLAFFNEYFTLCLVFPSLCILGLYLTCRLRCIQVSKLKMSFSILFKKEGSGEGNISHYQAVAAVLANNFGTGNISGMAIALTTGGPGALVWMWVMAFLGSAVQFANCLLGVKYRTKNRQGEFVGGPMYYLAEGLKWKKGAILFSICVILAAFGAGSFVQVNSIALPFSAIGIAPWISGIFIAILVAVVVWGGAQRVAQVSSAIVPVMAIFYLGGTGWILALHADQLLSSLYLMFQSAMGLSSATAGIAGYAVMKALTTGFDRAIFATDAGTGTVPILQSEAKTKHPVFDGVASLLAPLLVMVVCTATALTLIVTGAWQMSGLESTTMVLYAFNSVLGAKIGTPLVLIALFLFGYTTTISWSSCLQRSVGFLTEKKKWIRFFQFLYVVSVPLGALLDVSFVWIFADIALTAMLVINVAAVGGLSKEVIADTKAFFAPSNGKKGVLSQQEGSFSE